MKSIKHQLGDWEKIEILPLADLHIGDIHSDGEKIMEWLSYIAEHDNCFTILNGDLMDTAIKTSIGDTYGASLRPMEQLQQCVKLFEPVKGKILAVTAGNHENRIYRSDGLDTTQLMCEQLGISDRYSPASVIMFVQFGRKSGHHHEQPMLYSIFCLHGSGGGRKEGGKINRLADLAEIIDADVYIHSHTHLPAVFRGSYYRVNTRHCTVQQVDKLFINTSSSLSYGGYGEAQAYKPNSLETPMIILDGGRRGMRAVL